MMPALGEPPTRPEDFLRWRFICTVACRQRVPLPVSAGTRLPVSAQLSSALNQFQRRYGSNISEESDRSSCSFALEGQPGQAYNEEAFWYFLQIERRRADRSLRPFLLLLVDLKQQASVGIDPAVGAKLFSALSACVRETDFIGWYRGGRVAGAVLTQLADTPGTGISQVIVQRVSGTLRVHLPREIASSLQVSVYQFPLKLTGRS